MTFFRLTARRRVPSLEAHLIHQESIAMNSSHSLRAAARARPATRIWQRLFCAALGAGTLAALAAPDEPTAIAASERRALLALHANTGGTQWSVRTGWLGPRGSECDWYGVRCDDARRHVVAIDLTNNQLRGRLPPLGALTQLQELRVSVNHLEGPLPSLQALPRLRVLRANNNLLGGPVPSVRGLPDLERVVLANNHFEGYLPPLAGLAQLREFDVSNNRLVGAVPSLAGLDRLRRFDASFNRLRVTVAPDAGAATVVDLHGNLAPRARAAARS